MTIPEFDGVRLATKADEEDIFALLTMLHDENGFFAMSAAKVLAGIQRATDTKGGIIGVTRHGNRVVGTVGMFIEQDWYTEDPCLIERWNFVHKDFRRSDYAKRQIAFAKSCQQWFETSGITMPLFIGVVSTVRTEAKVRLYRRLLPFAGAFFLYGKTPRMPSDARPTTVVTKPSKADFHLLQASN